MELKRILLIVTGISGYEKVVEDAAEIASAFKSEIVALAVLDKNRVRQLSKFSNKSIEEIEVDLEEDAWSYLYFTEEIVLERDGRVFLRYEEGSVVEKVVQIANEIKADVVITQQPPLDKDKVFRSYLPSLIDHLNCSVLIINTK